uniref:Uncharacterized protein n=1 Tax=Amphiprion ocellaris TaxID=80972 RepID=A0A3Q1BST2_AMPOC
SYMKLGCSLYLFSCTIQGNIFINYFLNTGFLVSIWRREVHHIPQFCIAMKFAVIVITVSGFNFSFKCEGGEGRGQVTVSTRKHDVHRSWGNNRKNLPAWITFHMLYKGQCV